MNGAARGTFLLMLVLTLSACGFTPASRSPGYADIEALPWRHVDQTLTLSFGPRVLRFAARWVEDDPGVRELLRSLDGVRVQRYEIDGDALQVAASLNEASRLLQQQGWQAVVRVVEEGEVTHVLLRQSGDTLAGLTVLSSDAAEVVVVNMMGQLQPEILQQIIRAHNAPALPVSPT
jgi:hypothetical protein